MPRVDDKRNEEDYRVQLAKEGSMPENSLQVKANSTLILQDRGVTVGTKNLVHCPNPNQGSFHTYIKESRCLKRVVHREVLEGVGHIPISEDEGADLGCELDSYYNIGWM
ncbi:hypothetical protein V6N13_109024 [Hibiscus sabdariffa]|uniref:Uncharacterized protein n=1 Tax=Hibiscus sabdariffa TaxID=183260 RepID=A0ABR2FNC2_9ROSI